MTTAIHLPERPAIDYPESDGLPIADNTLQFRWISTIMWGLDAQFVHDPNVFVAGNLLWYPVEGAPTIRIGPDVLIALGRPRGERRSYKQWEEAGLPPQVVFEILSPGNRPAAMEEKFKFYERHGVEEYYLYDPDDGSLQGWLRAGAELREVPRMAGFVSPRLGITFDPGEGADNLRIFGPDGTPFLTFTEWVEKSKAEQRRADAAEERADEQTRLALAEHHRVDEQMRVTATERQRADAERLRADAERLRADAERLRADAERLRAERLAARLRDLGIEPE
jgi:Uma2 family endonuclease